VKSTEFAEAAKKLVREYAEKNLDATAPEFDVYIVWQCYILGSMKALLSTTLRDGMYYEVTYSGAKDEIYLDAYRKIDNHAFKVEV